MEHPRPLHARQGEPGIWCTVPRLAVGKLQHCDFHPIESILLGGNQAERHSKPNLLVEASFNYDGNIIDITNSALANNPPAGAQVPFFNNGSQLVPRWTAPGALRTTPTKQMGSAPWHNAAQDYMPKGDLSYTRGKHAMKFGVSYNRIQKTSSCSAT